MSKEPVSAASAEEHSFGGSKEKDAASHDETVSRHSDLLGASVDAEFGGPEERAKLEVSPDSSCSLFLAHPNAFGVVETSVMEGRPEDVDPCRHLHVRTSCHRTDHYLLRAHLCFLFTVSIM